ncbi:hypothetical protein BDV3_003258 [Batrachochytrium dendrobatidis]
MTENPANLTIPIQPESSTLQLPHRQPTLQLTRMSHFCKTFLYKELERSLDLGFAAVWARQDLSRISLQEFLDDVIVDLSDCKLWVFSWNIQNPVSSYIPVSTLIRESSRGGFDASQIYDTAGSTENKSTREYTLYLEAMHNLFERKLGYTRLGCYFLKSLDACTWPTRGICVFRLFIYLVYGKLVIQPVQSILRLEPLNPEWLKKHSSISKKIKVFIAPHGICAQLIPSEYADIYHILESKDLALKIQVTFLDAPLVKVEVAMQSIFVSSDMREQYTLDMAESLNSQCDRLTGNVSEAYNVHTNSLKQFQLLDSTLSKVGELEAIYDALDVLGGDTDTPPAIQSTDLTTTASGYSGSSLNMLGLTMTVEKESSPLVEEAAKLALSEPFAKQHTRLVSPIPKPETDLDMDLSLDGLGNMGELTDLALGDGVTDEDFDFFETKRPISTPKSAVSVKTPSWTLAASSSTSVTTLPVISSASTPGAGSSFLASALQPVQDLINPLRSHTDTSAVAPSPVAPSPGASFHPHTFSPYGNFTTPQYNPMSPAFIATNGASCNTTGLATVGGLSTSPGKLRFDGGVSPAESPAMVFGSPQFMHGDAATPHFAQSSPFNTAGSHIPASPAVGPLVTTSSMVQTPSLTTDRVISRLNEQHDDPSMTVDSSQFTIGNEVSVCDAFVVESEPMKVYQSLHPNQTVKSPVSDDSFETEILQMTMPEAWLPFRIRFDLVFGAKINHNQLASFSKLNDLKSIKLEDGSIQAAEQICARYGSKYAKWCYRPTARRATKKIKKRAVLPGTIKQLYDMNVTKNVRNLVQRTLAEHENTFSKSPQLLKLMASDKMLTKTDLFKNTASLFTAPHLGWLIGNFSDATAFMPFDTCLELSDCEIMWHQESKLGRLDEFCVPDISHLNALCFDCGEHRDHSSKCECCTDFQNIPTGTLIGPLPWSLPATACSNKLFDTIRMTLVSLLGMNSGDDSTTLNISGPLALLEYHNLQEIDLSTTKYGGFQVRKKKRIMEPVVDILAAPDIIFRHDGALISANPFSYRFWTKLRLEPYAGRKRIAYFGVCGVSDKMTTDTMDIEKSSVVETISIQMKQTACMWMTEFQNEWDVHRFGDCKPLMESVELSTCSVNIPDNFDVCDGASVTKLFSKAFTKSICKRARDFIVDITSPYTVSKVYDGSYQSPNTLSKYCSHLCIFIFIPPYMLYHAQRKWPAKSGHISYFVQLSLQLCDYLACFVSKLCSISVDIIRSRIVFKPVVFHQDRLYSALVTSNDCHDVYNQCQWVLPAPVSLRNANSSRPISMDHSNVPCAIPAPSVILDDKREGRQAFLSIRGQDHGTIDSDSDGECTSYDEFFDDARRAASERLIVEPVRVAHVVYWIYKTELERVQIFVRWTDHRGELSGAGIVSSRQLESRSALFGRMIENLQCKFGQRGFAYRLAVFKIGSMDRLEMQDWILAMQHFCGSSIQESTNPLKDTGIDTTQTPLNKNVVETRYQPNSQIGDSSDVPIELDLDSESSRSCMQKPAVSCIVSISVFCISTCSALQCSRPCGSAPFGPLNKQGDGVWCEDSVPCAIFTLSHHRVPLPVISFGQQNLVPFLPLSSGWILKGSQSMRLSLLWHSLTESAALIAPSRLRHILVDEWDQEPASSPVGSSSTGYLAALPNHCNIVRDVLKQLCSLDHLYKLVSDE